MENAEQPHEITQEDIDAVSQVMRELTPEMVQYILGAFFMGAASLRRSLDEGQVVDIEHVHVWANEQIAAASTDIIGMSIHLGRQNVKAVPREDEPNGEG